MPAGVGFSSLGTVATPSNGGSFVSRLYRVGSSAGEEVATSGFLTLNFSLVTMFELQ